MAALNTDIYRDRPDSFLDDHFLPSRSVGNPQVWIDRAIALGKAGEPALRNSELDVSYGPSPLQTYDVFRSREPDAPVVVYFHGGYWRSYDKANYRYIAGMLVSQGVTAVLANYDLCPAVTLDDIVSQARACVAHVYRNAARFGADPNRLFLTGSSAGGHLVAMTIAHDFTRQGLPADLIKGALSITGVHRLEPVLRVHVNDDIRLTAESARRNTTLDRTPITKRQVTVAVGGDEPSEWIRMSVDYDTMLREAGIPGELLILSGVHHYSITQTLADPGSPLSQSLLQMVRDRNCP